MIGMNDDMAISSVKFRHDGTPVLPESVPINMLIPLPGSKLADAPPVDPIEFIRIITLARILMPQSHVRLTAGHTEMTDKYSAREKRGKTCC